MSERDTTTATSIGTDNPLRDRMDEMMIRTYKGPSLQQGRRVAVEIPVQKAEHPKRDDEGKSQEAQEKVLLRLELDVKHVLGDDGVIPLLSP